MRVVSLLPSATEIVYALGLDDQLVGVTFECDEPSRARQDKTVVIGGRDTSGMTPGAIDAYVRDQVAAGQDLYTLRADALAALAPELILTQDLCRVCALPAGQVSDALDYLGCTAEVVSLDPHRLDDVLATILTIGRHAGAPQRAEELVAALRRRLTAVADRIASQVTAGHRPAVAMIEWVDPPFAAGHWVPDLVTAAGGRPVAADAGGRSAPASWDQIAAARPDLVVVAPCGFGLDDAAAQAELAVRQLPGTPVWAIDAGGLVVRPGPRLVDGVEALAAIVHPDAAATVPAGRIRRIA
ncbi:MAG TPA: ABC transporter substrate-binding protein [Streptosporangiaceae bacterium]|jgi:iron complex transport system substrate-binding protein